MVPRLWANPKTDASPEAAAGKAQEQLDAEFKDFFRNAFAEFAKYGEVEDVVVVRWPRAAPRCLAD